MFFNDVVNGFFCFEGNDCVFWFKLSFVGNVLVERFGEFDEVLFIKEDLMIEFVFFYLVLLV